MLPVIITLVVVGALATGWWLSRRSARMAQGRANALGEVARTHLGAARAGAVYGSMPFGMLAIAQSEISLALFGREHRFCRDRVRRLVEERGLFSQGLRIEHTEPGEPDEMVFWTPAFGEVRRDLEQLGYEVERRG